MQINAHFYPESDSESHARSGADVKGKKRGEPGHSMQDIAWTKVDTDDEGVFERGNGKWSGFPDPDPVHPAQHRRGGGDVSSDDDDTRFIYVNFHNCSHLPNYNKNVGNCGVFDCHCFFFIF